MDEQNGRHQDAVGKRGSGLLAVIALALSVGCSQNHNGARPTPTTVSDEAAVERLIFQQREFVKERNWGALYDTYAPGAQQTCARDDFIRHRDARIPATTDLRNLAVDDLHVRIDGDTAYASYIDRLDGTPVATATDAKPDLYTKVDGAWYDEFDPTSSC